MKRMTEPNWDEVQLSLPIFLRVHRAETICGHCQGELTPFRLLCKRKCSL